MCSRKEQPHNEPPPVDPRRVEPDLQRSRNLLAQFVNALPQPVFWKDRDSVYLGCNAAFARLAGLEDSSQIVGKTDRDLPWRDQSEVYRAEDRDVMENNRPMYHVVGPRRQAGDTWRWVDANKTPLTDDAGRIWGLLGIHEDITERIQAEEALQEDEKRLSSLGRNIPGVIYQFQLTPDGKYSFPYVNERWLDFFGMAPEEAMASADSSFARIVPEDLAGVNSTIMQSARTLEPWICEFRVKVGERIKWVHGRSIPEQPKSDGSILWNGVLLDITERKQADESLKESESRLRSIIESSQDGIIFFDGKARKIIFGNGAMAELLGCSREDLVDRSIQSLHPAKEWERVEQEFLKHLSGEHSFSTGIPVLRRDGSVFYADIRSNLIVLDGRSYFSAFFHDITKRRQAEWALSESEKRFRMLFDSSADGILLTIPDGRILAANQAACRMLGRSEAQICQAGREGIVDIQDPGLLALLDERARTGSAKGELTMIRGDGSRFRAEVSSAIFETGEGPRTSLVIRDITERKRAEQALDESEKKLRSIFEDSPAGVALVALDGRYLTVNPAFSEIFGYSAEELLRASLFDVTHPDDRKLSEEVMRQVLDGKGKSIRFMNRYLHKDGHTIWAEVCSELVYGADGQPVHFITHVIDVTERKKAEAKVAEQAALLETANDAIMVRDLNHRILYWNKGCERLYGWEAVEALERPSPELVDVDRPAFEAAFQRFMKDGAWAGELRNTAKDGREIVVLGRWTLVRDEQGRPKSVLVINTDITEKKQLQTQLLRAQRLESIGQLASGIAHDLNNILSPIIMVAPLLRMEIKKPEILRLIDILEANTRRGADVVKQILTFARGLKGGKGPVPTRPLLKEVAAVLEETFPKAITVESSIPEDLWTVEGDATQLQQVLMNLCVNARDAMPDGGTLILAGENILADDLFVRTMPQAKPGPYVVWLVADTGTGISPENLDRIFDPFFTTKEVGKGTGLGLATVVGIVRNHAGFIKVESKEGKGTRFRVYLPALPEQAGVTDQPPAPPPRGKGETILVVDDEEGVRLTTRKTLEEHGYRVLLAGEGSEAVMLFAQHPAEIRAVLTDLMMPVMDGVALVRALRQVAPEIKVLATTGVTETAQTNAVMRLGAKAVIRKPFSAHRLLWELHAILDEGGAPAPGVPDKFVD